MPVHRRPAQHPPHAAAAALLLSLGAALGAGACGGGGGPTTPVTSLGAPVLLWERGGCFDTWCQTGWYASPGVADLDADGVKEIVWASYDTVALRPDGTVKWRRAGAGRSFGSPVVADVTGDAALEVVATRGQQIAYLDASGVPYAGASPFGSAEVRSLAAGDVAGGAGLELVAARAGAGATGQVTVLDAQGVALTGWPALHAGDPGYGWGLYGQNLAVADLLGDAKAEIVAPSDVHYVMAFRGDGSQLPANARYGAGKVWSEVGLNHADAADLRGYTLCDSERRFNFADSPASVADLDGDGAREIVLVGNLYDCSADPYTSVARLPIVLNADRSRWKAGAFDWTALPPPGAGAGPRSEDYSVIESVQSSPVLADLDGDGQKEILFASYDGRLHAYWLDETEHGSWPWAVPGTGIRFASEPAVADLDGDGKAEVVVGTWTETASGSRGTLAILDWQGRPLHEVVLPASFPAGQANGAMGAPTLANVDAGPEAEVLVGTRASGVVAYRIPGSVLTGIRWGTGRGSLLRNGTAP